MWKKLPLMFFLENSGVHKIRRKGLESLELAKFKSSKIKTAAVTLKSNGTTWKTIKYSDRVPNAEYEQFSKQIKCYIFIRLSLELFQSDVFWYIVIRCWSNHNPYARHKKSYCIFLYILISWRGLRGLGVFNHLKLRGGLTQKVKTVTNIYSLVEKKSYVKTFAMIW